LMIGIYWFFSDVNWVQFGFKKKKKFVCSHIPICFVLCIVFGRKSFWIGLMTMMIVASQVVCGVWLRGWILALICFLV